MTRSASTVACLLALGACQSESELRFVSTLDAQTNGVQFSQDGNQSHVGMSGMTCTVSTEWGCPTDDADLPTEREVVLDHLDGQTLAASDSAVHVIDGSGWIREADIPVPQVIAARYTESGVMMLRGEGEGCELLLGESRRSMPAEVCAEGVAVDVDRSGAALYVASDMGVYVLDSAGARRLVRSADIVAWDPTLKRAYVARRAGTEVTAIKAGGSEIWTADVGYPITDLETRGDRGQLLVLVEDDEGMGRVIRLNGEDGRQMGESILPDGEGDLVVSDNGQTVGVVRPEQVHFFSLVLPDEGEREAREDEPKDCLRGDRLGID